jgi:hypothetical protein
VNEFRKKEENKRYKDQDASVAINGKNEKRNLPPTHLFFSLIMVQILGWVLGVQPHGVVDGRLHMYDYYFLFG